MSGTSVLFAMISPGTMMIILVLAVLLYGKRLPEVARTVGKGLSEFQKGLRGIEHELHSAINSSTASSSPSSSSASSSEYAYHDEVDGYEEATAPKFEPPPSEHQAGVSPQLAATSGPPAATGEPSAATSEQPAAPSEQPAAPSEQPAQTMHGPGSDVH